MIKELKHIKDNISRIEFNISLYNNFKHKQHKFKDIFITTFKFIFLLYNNHIYSIMIKLLKPIKDNIGRKQLKPIKDNIGRIEVNVSLYDNFKKDYLNRIYLNLKTY